MKKENLKSDVDAKAAFILYLQQNGFENAKVISTPCDISAEKNGEKWYFEIKMTNKNDVYFGAATMTEWEQAFKTPNYFRFVIAIKNKELEGGFTFLQLTPQEMIKYSTIPPFKVYFNIDLQKYMNNEDSVKSKNKTRKKKAIRLTEQGFGTILQSFKKVEEDQVDL